nr:MAG TPA: hypothetical protein [Caudoviricetes sp.]
MYEYPDYLMHHGVKGMRWGIRRYQNKDGSLTNAGKKRQSYRNEDITRRQKNIDLHKKSIIEDQKAIKDLQKNGIKSKYYSAKQFSEKDAKDEYGVSKKEILKDDIQGRQNSIDVSKSQINKESKYIKNIKSTPIGEKSITEVTKSQSRRASAGVIIGAAAPIAISALAVKTGKMSVGKAITINLLTASPVVGGITGGVAGSSIKTRSEKKVYDRVNKN